MSHNIFHKIEGYVESGIDAVGDVFETGANLLGFGGGDTSTQSGQHNPFMFLNPSYGQTNLSLFPSMNTALGGGEYSTGLQFEQQNVPGGYHQPPGAVGPMPGIERTTSVGFLPSAGGGLSPYTYETTGVEAAYPEWKPQTSMMERIMGIGSEHLRMLHKWAVPGETEGAFRSRSDLEESERGGWTDMTDEDVLAEISSLSEEDRGKFLPQWTIYATLEDVQNKADFVNFRNEQTAASMMDQARTTAQTMGMLTGLMGMSEYADIIQRSQQMGEQVWGNFRDRGYDTSTAYSSAIQTMEQAKNRMFSDFNDTQLTRRLGALQMSNNIMQQAFMGVQRTPPDPMAIAQIIHGQVAGGSGQQQPQAGNPFISQLFGTVAGALVPG